MKTYYYEQAGQQAGPITVDLLLSHGVEASTLVWSEDMSDWAPAASLAELAPLFQPVPPPLPPRLPSRVASESTTPVPAENTGASFPPLPQQSVPPLSVAEHPLASTGNQLTLAQEPTARPQFSTEASTRQWWHYILYAVLIFIMLLLFRACGAIIGKAVSATGHSLPASTCLATVATTGYQFAEKVYSLLLD